MIGFESFQISSWFLNGIAIAPPKHGRRARSASKRDTPWKMTMAASFAAVGIAVSGGVDAGLASGVASLQIAHKKADQPRDGSDSYDREADQTLAQFLQGYDGLLSAISSRALTYSTAQTELAELTSRFRNPTLTDPQAWARRLAHDTKDAED